MTSNRFLAHRNNLTKNLFFSFLFILFLILGVSVYKDYGVSFDEPSQRILNGIVNYNYIVHGNYNELIKSNEKYHGPAFEILLVVAEKILNLTDSREICLMRHLLTFFTFALGVLFFYLICLRFLKNEIIGIIGCTFLVLSPRIFAESFYNSKDIVFLAFIIINIYTALLFAERKTFTTAFFHALVTAFVIDIRVTGIIIPVISSLILIIDLFTNQETRKMKSVIAGCTYLIITAGVVILFWPVLWKNPVHHFINAIAEMSHYHWKGKVLYMGEFISAEKLPWHYIPVWFFITTPLLYFILFFSGIVIFFRSLFKEGFSELMKSHLMIVNLTIFFIPLLAVIFLHSVVYDSWRHLYFIYPSFLLVGLVGLQKIIERITAKRVAKIIVYGFLSVSLISTSFAMIRLHPFENVYFNSLAGKNMEGIKQNFEMDYWGLSYKDGLNYILDHDSDSIVKIYPDNYSGQVNSDILTKDKRQRIKFTDSVEEAKYFISNFRWHPEQFSIEKEFFSIKAGDSDILVVYKITPLFISFYNKSKWHY
jgi:hypothetical protein